MKNLFALAIVGAAIFWLIRKHDAEKVEGNSDVFFKPLSSSSAAGGSLVLDPSFVGPVKIPTGFRLA